MSDITLSPDTLTNSEKPGLYTRWLNVTVSHLEDGASLRLICYHVLTLRNGATRHSSKSITVTDAALQARLRREVKPGDTIRVCLETDWDDEEIPTILKDFCRL